jgi:hypothetical protein
LLIEKGILAGVVNSNRRNFMDRYDSERLISKFGFEKGLDLLNVIAAKQLGMIPENRVVHYVKENIQFFSNHEENAPV